MKRGLITGVLALLAVVLAGCAEHVQEDSGPIQPIVLEPITDEPAEDEQVSDDPAENGSTADQATADQSAGKKSAEEKETKNRTSAMQDTDGSAEKTEQKDSGTKRKPAEEAYFAVVEELYRTHTLPDGTDLGYDEISDLSGNQFAIYDIDQDGKEELIVIWTTTYTAGMSEMIYDFDSASGTLREELRVYPMLTFYDNGVLEAGMSHNHGLAGDMDFWPYTLYQYDKNTDTYVVAGVVDAWNKAFYEKDGQGREFPDDLDADGDGVVYKITAGEEERLIDLEEYQKWRGSVIGESKKVEIPFQKMTEENIGKK